MERLFFIVTVFWALAFNGIAQDNLKGSWLPKEQDLSLSSHGISEMDTFLNPLGITIRPLICSYEGEVLVSATRIQEEDTAFVHSSSWVCKTDTKKVSDQTNVSDFYITFSVEKGMLESGGVAVAFDFLNLKRDK